MLTTALSSCTGVQTTYADLERDQTARDRLPESSATSNSGDPVRIIGESARLVAVEDDTEIYLATASESGKTLICLIVYGAASHLQSCGSDGLVLTDSVNEYTVIADDFAESQLDPDEGWTRLSENVFTRPVVDETADTQ